jgi:hypothetical protein
MESPPGSPPAPSAPLPPEGPAPAWLIWLGGLTLLVVLLWAAFSLGVFVAERGLTRPVLPPWPAPPAAAPGPTLPPLPTPSAARWPASVAPPVAV